MRKAGREGGGGTQLQAGALTTRPASFQGNRDESTNVDMSLVQRDAQVGVLARGPSWASGVGVHLHFLSLCFHMYLF